MKQGNGQVIYLHLNMIAK